MKNITIVFGSTTGNTETAAEMIQSTLSGKGATVSLHNVSAAPADALASADLILLGSSTWGEGELQDDFIDFYDGMNKDQFADKEVAVFGCGDSAMFPHVFCEAVTMIEAKSNDCGAKVVVEGLKIDGDVSDNADQIEAWAAALV